MSNNGPMLDFKLGVWVTAGGLRAHVVKEEVSGHYVKRLRGFIINERGEKEEAAWYAHNGMVFLAGVEDDLDLKVYLPEESTVQENTLQQEGEELQPTMQDYRDALALLAKALPEDMHVDLNKPLELARDIHHYILHEMSNMQNRMTLVKDLLAIKNKHVAQLESELETLRQPTSNRLVG